MVRKPNNAKSRLEQIRPPIVRSEGYTESEKYLATLADRSFLNLWSYPNPHRAQKLRGRGDGKELCDLLVVCDPHVLIFSEKNITWTEKTLDVAWPRWCRRAIFDGANQLKGAERWINEFPDRIFLDKQCAVPFPLGFPPLDRRRIHRIVVARGAKDACCKYFGGGLGTLIVRPNLRGPDHQTPSADNYAPFTIGDIDPEGDFIHVFDEVSLDIVMRELDTISDFTQYLDKRTAFLRSGRLEVAHGEEDLLAFYAVRVNEEGDHDFTAPEGRSWSDIESVVIGPGNWAKYVNDPRYRAKKESDKISYAWDRLIETFTNHLLGGTTIVLPGHTYSLTDSELAVRYMAMQDRFSRRGHSEAILDALQIGRSEQVFFRALLAPPESPRSETGFFFLTLKYQDWMDDEGGYDRYREMRTFYLRTYAQALLIKHPYLRRIIGIAMEPPAQGKGTSEDIIYGAQTEWTDEDLRQNQEDCAALGIMGQMKVTHYHGIEYPNLQQSVKSALRGNRKQRRAQAARNRRQRRKR